MSLNIPGSTHRTEHAPVRSHRERLFRVACYLCNIELPDGPQRGRLAAAVQVMAMASWILALLILFVYIVLPYIGQSTDEFIKGWYAGYHGIGASVPADYGPSAKWTLYVCAWIMAVIWFIGAVREKAFKHTAASLVFERESAARKQAESTLRLLKAQIEPHFLFNTLGAVQQLAEGKAPEAAALTAELITFLRATLSSLRRDRTCLADDLAICDAYLHIMQTRLGHRLSFSIDCPPSVAKVSLPNTLLLTLLENAIKHGIERSSNGGRIDITVRHVTDDIVIEVADSGAGFSDAPGQGVGLQNVREQLALSFGARASLVLEAKEPQGVVARITIPAAT